MSSASSFSLEQAKICCLGNTANRSPDSVDSRTVNVKRYMNGALVKGYLSTPLRQLHHVCKLSHNYGYIKSSWS